MGFSFLAVFLPSQIVSRLIVLPSMTANEFTISDSLRFLFVLVVIVQAIHFVFSNFWDRGAGSPFSRSELANADQPTTSQDTAGCVPVVGSYTPCCRPVH